MKSAKLFFFVIVTIFFSISSITSAQKARPAGTPMLTKEVYDSLKAEINALPDTDQNKKFFAFIHDFLLKEGDARWVNMNGPAIKSLKNDVGCVAEFTASLKESLNDVEVALSGDQTPVEITETKVEVKSVSAAEDAMNKIKASVAARRAAPKY